MKGFYHLFAILTPLLTIVFSVISARMTNQKKGFLITCYALYFVGVAGYGAVLLYRLHESKVKILFWVLISVGSAALLFIYWIKKAVTIKLTSKQL